MSRVLVLIGAFLFFRSVLPRTSRRSPTAITPYMNALDGVMSAQQASSVLDEFTPYESWLASHRAKVRGTTQDNKLPSNSTEVVEPTVFAARSGQRRSMRP